VENLSVLLSVLTIKETKRR